MSDRDGDPAKKPEACRAVRFGEGCPNLKETGGGFEGERYDCEVCGEHYYLSYEDMA